MSSISKNMNKNLVLVLALIVLVIIFTPKLLDLTGKATIGDLLPTDADTITDCEERGGVRIWAGTEGIGDTTCLAVVGNPCLAVYDLLEAGGPLRIERCDELVHATRQSGLTACCGPTPTKAPAEPGLIAYYKFDGNALDETLNNNDGTVQGATPTEGKIGQALEFDGVNDYINIGSITGYSSSTATISAWIYPKSSSTHKVIWSNLDDDNNGLFLFMQLTDNKLSVNGEEGGHSSVSTGGTETIQLDQWTHVVLTLDSNNYKAKIYINGILVSSTNYLDTTANTHYIGTYNSNILFFKGKIDEVRIYNKALTDTEVQTLYEYTGEPECIPECTGKECGDDGCEGSCGDCLINYECEYGKCVCIPDCVGKECGDNGCAGWCGYCSGGSSCIEDICVPDCGNGVCDEDEDAYICPEDCIIEPCDGCSATIDSKEVCIPYGQEVDGQKIRIPNNDKYCGDAGPVNLFSYNQDCEYDYECESNICRDVEGTKICISYTRLRQTYCELLNLEDEQLVLCIFCGNAQLDTAGDMNSIIEGLEITENEQCDSTAVPSFQPGINCDTYTIGDKPEGYLVCNSNCVIDETGCESSE